MSRSAPNSSNASAQIELHKALAPRYAYRYSFEFSRLFQEDWHACMLRLMPADAKRVLDLGCGTGFFLAELEQRRPGAVGLDISHAMLQVSEQYVPGARLITADAEKLPFKDGCFDTVFCKGSLHHTRDHVRFLKNCRRALSQDGVLIMSEPCNDNFVIRFARYVLYRFSPHFDLGDQGFTKNGLIELYERAGFEVTYAGRYGVLAYMLAGFPDHLGLLRWIPGNAGLTRFFLRLDRWICSTRVLRILSFQVVVSGRPARAQPPA
jgi:ubiquinone/menaquinone biosynthesis C-methylase UbiE